MAGVLYAEARRLVQLLGVDDALKFAAAFGGRRLYVPKARSLKADGAIVAAIGADAAMKIVAEYRGLEIMVPKCQRWLIAKRNAVIWSELQAGRSVRSVAERFGMTERNVSRIAAATRGARNPRASI